MKLDLQMCDELLGTTRAVRKRLDLTRKVPRNIVEECLELAVQAPHRIKFPIMAMDCH